MKFPQTLYFDHQASTPVDEQVLGKMLPFFIERSGNPHSADHVVGWKSSQAVAESACNIANMIGADEDEIVFTSGATEANNLALLGLAKREAGGKRRRIVTSVVEHKCVLAIARILEDQLGYCVDRLPVDMEGRVSMSVLESALDEKVLAVSIMAVNNEIGTIQDIKGISDVVRNVGAVFHCDAAQAPIAMNMTSFAPNVDLLSLSAHKMYGPQGVGALYVCRDLQERIEPLMYGGGQQKGLRSGTTPVPLCVGMGAAAQLMSGEECDKKRNLLRDRRDRFVEKLCDLHWELTVNGPVGQERHSGNANILFRGFSAHDILNSLQPQLAASTGSACTTGIPEPSHVLKAIGLSGSEAEASVRFSLGFGTSEEDVDNAVGLIDAALESLSINLAESP